MKITGKLIFKSEDASELVDIIARSLAPDNLSNTITVTGENTACVTFTSNKIGTILSSVDDYLMNANIAQKVSSFLKENYIKKT